MSPLKMGMEHQQGLGIWCQLQTIQIVDLNCLDISIWLVPSLDGRGLSGACTDWAYASFWVHATRGSLRTLSFRTWSFFPSF